MSTVHPDLTGTGTPEGVWQRWPVLHELPELVVPRRTRWPWADDVVVVAPHPDDEVLGIGGTMELLAASGARITLIAVTDGENSHPDSRTLTPAQLAQRRRIELREALNLLDLQQIQIRHLGLPDGSVAEHESALADELSDRLSDTSLCIATWYLDGHPDHDAVGRAARAATERTGARLLSYPLWMWHWSRPGDPSVPWGRLHRLKLPARTVAIKRAAATRFVTQVRPLSPRPEDAPVLPEPVLRRLLRDYEVFVG